MPSLHIVLTILNICNVNVKRGLHVCRGLGTMENTSTKCPAQPSSPMSAVIQSVTQTSGARPWALRTPAGMETRDNIDKIKCNARALKENNALNDRSIVKVIKEVKVDLFFVNIQSLKNNLNDLKKDIYAAKANFICLAETWLEENETIEYEGWNFYHSSKGRGKGCCLFYREGIECDLIGHFATDSFSLLSVKMNEATQLFIVYLSQAKNGVKDQL